MVMSEEIEKEKRQTAICKYRIKELEVNVFTLL